jgi:PAS domain-containing protein
LACAAVVFLLASVGFLRERSKPQQFSETGPPLHDISAQAEDAMAESESRYRALFENMLEGFAHCEMLFDDCGRPTDFVYLDVNCAFGKLTGLTNVVGKKFTEVIPGEKGLTARIV